MVDHTDRDDLIKEIADLQHYGSEGPENPEHAMETLNQLIVRAREVSAEEKRDARVETALPAIFDAAEKLLWAIDHNQSADEAMAALRLAVTKARYGETAH